MIWQFKKLHKGGNCTTEITVELKEAGLYAIADDDHYHGWLDREESLALAWGVLEKLDPPPARLGTHARVVAGPMCGADGFVCGTARETGQIILRCREGILLQPPEFVRVGP